MRFVSLLVLTACGAPVTRGPPADDTADTASADDTASPVDTAVDEAWYGPAAYPTHALHSPLTPYVVDRLRAIAAIDDGLHDDVFMKVGDSITVSTASLACFSTTSDLGDHGDLEPILVGFLEGDAGGATPFARTSAAAKIGRSAVWAVTGDPSPLAIEAAAVSPRWALVQFGTNDLQHGTTPDTALPGFYESLDAIVLELVDQGIVPILFTIPARTDLDSVGRWVPTYNAVIRGVAQRWQVPLVDFHGATFDLPGHGLASDGVHPNAWSGGACALTDAGLGYGYNTRNLVALQALDRVTAAVLDGAALDVAMEPPDADGRPDDPIPVGSLPWVDARDTTAASDAWDAYACSAADESGPEIVYRLHLDAPTRLRAVVLDRAGVDVDVHLLDASGTPEGCLGRADRTLSGTVPAGEYRLVVDTWVDGTGSSLHGPYLLVVVECADDDPDCDGPI